MVGSSSLGLLVSGGLSVSFKFWSRCWYFARSVKIWPIFGQIHRIWTRSRRNIAGSRHIWWISSRSSSEKQKYRLYLSFFVGKPLNVVGCCWGDGWVGWLEFLGRKPSNQLEGFGFCEWRPVADRLIGQLGWWPVGFGQVQRVGRVMRTRGHP